MFSALSSEDMRAAQIITGATMALFILISVTPGLRVHAGRIRLALLVLYLLACCVLLGVVLLR